LQASETNDDTDPSTGPRRSDLGEIDDAEYAQEQEGTGVDPIYPRLVPHVEGLSNEIIVETECYSQENDGSEQTENAEDHQNSSVTLDAVAVQGRVGLFVLHELLVHLRIVQVEAQQREIKRCANDQVHREQHDCKDKVLVDRKLFLALL
jgi:hypothetical protein